MKSLKVRRGTGGRRTYLGIPEFVPILIKAYRLKPGQTLKWALLLVALCCHFWDFDCLVGSSTCCKLVSTCSDDCSLKACLEDRDEIIVPQCPLALDSLPLANTPPVTKGFGLPFQSVDLPFRLLLSGPVPARAPPFA